MLLKKWMVICAVCLSSWGSLSAASAETPSGPFYTQENPQLEFNYFKTYASNPDKDNARPLDVFAQATTTFVYAEIEFKNLLYNQQDREYKLTYKFYLENGDRLGETSSTFLVEKGWESAYYFDSWGWDDPGQWPLGRHRIELWVNDTKFAVKTFTVVD